jgi:hypothetical protein
LVIVEQHLRQARRQRWGEHVRTEPRTEAVAD